MPAWFNPRKAAQVAAYFALAQGGTVNVLKLVKLLYLADRRFMEKYDSPILNDRLVSMPHGPVNSITLSYLDGCLEDGKSLWDEFISDRANHDIGLTNEAMSHDDLDEISQAEMDVLAEIWGEFGSMTPYQIRDYTHENCLEWEDPKGSSNPIPYARVFKFLGKKDGEALAGRVQSEWMLDEMLAIDQGERSAAE